jgi:hypothetical protein
MSGGAVTKAGTVGQHDLTVPDAMAIVMSMVGDRGDVDSGQHRSLLRHPGPRRRGVTSYEP